jgi:succinyl-diaminopimelate desuccinylase
MPTKLRTDAQRARKVLRWLRQRQEEMAALLAELVAIPTENPPGANLSGCADLLEARLRKSGLSCERVRCDAGFPRVDLHSRSKGLTVRDAPVALLAEYGDGQPVLHFHGHYDVVPAQSPEQFRPRRRDQFLFGRGTCDMKGGVVAMLYAIRALQAGGAKLNGKIALTVVPDEETGGARGSAALARQGRLGHTGIGMLTAEPTSGVVWNANRGAVTLRVRIFGKSAHVGLQHHGQNAFERMHRVVGKLLDLQKQVQARKTRCEIGARQRSNSILLVGGQSAGGTNFNVVPDQCWFTIDRRINPEESLPEEKGRLLDVLERCRRDGISLDWEILQEGESAASPHDGALAQALARSVEVVTGKSPRFEMCPGLLETRFYASIGIPSYAYGPGLLSVAHGPNEYVDLGRVAECAAIYALAAIEVLGA